MMNYPPSASSSGNSFAETFEHLVSLRRALLELVRLHGIQSAVNQSHSLFSSTRSFRSDELATGLRMQPNPFSFTAN
jgi:hypothetical protein